MGNKVPSDLAAGSIAWYQPWGGCLCNIYQHGRLAQQLLLINTWSAEQVNDRWDQTWGTPSAGPGGRHRDQDNIGSPPPRRCRWGVEELSLTIAGTQLQKSCPRIFWPIRNCSLVRGACWNSYICGRKRGRQDGILPKFTGSQVSRRLSLCILDLPLTRSVTASRFCHFLKAVSTSVRCRW